MTVHKLISSLFWCLFLVSCGGTNTSGPRALPLLPLELPHEEMGLLAVKKFAPPKGEDYTRVERSNDIVHVSAKDFIFNGKSDVLALELAKERTKKVIIHAENLTLRGALTLHGGVIEIIADLLRFEGEGEVDVSGADGEMGESGQRGGELLLQVEKTSDNSLVSRPRFFAHGGKGGDSLPGRAGAKGKSVAPLAGSIIFEEIYRQTCNIAPRGGLALSESCYVKLEKQQGTKSCPTDGEKAVSASAPGAGGSAGNIKTFGAAKSILALMGSALVGSTGKKGESYQGGEAGTPREASYRKVIIKANGSREEIALGRCPSTRPGEGAHAPEALEAVNAVPLNLEFRSASQKDLALYLYASDLFARGLLKEARAYLASKKELGYHFHALYLKTFTTETSPLESYQDVEELTDFLIALKERRGQEELLDEVLFSFEGHDFAHSLTDERAREIARSLRLYVQSLDYERENIPLRSSLMESEIAELLTMIEREGSAELDRHRSLFDNLLRLKEKEQLRAGQVGISHFLGRTLFQTMRLLNSKVTRPLEQYQIELWKLVKSEALSSEQSWQVRERLMSFWPEYL